MKMRKSERMFTTTAMRLWARNRKSDAIQKYDGEGHN